MVYSKPQLVLLENALTAVKGQTKLGAVPDAVAPHNRRNRAVGQCSPCGSRPNQDGSRA